MAELPPSLQVKLAKKWLSNKAARDGMVECFVLTLERYEEKLSQRGLTRENMPTPLKKTVYDCAVDAFKAINVDYELPTKSDLQRIKTMMEERLPFLRMDEVDTDLRKEHERMCSALLEKME